jgi:hypothetical protein
MDRLVQAAREGDCQSIRDALATGEDIHQIDDLGNSLLYYASLTGQREVVKFLLDSGAKDDAQHRCYFNALANCKPLLKPYRNKKRNGEVNKDARSPMGYTLDNLIKRTPDPFISSLRLSPESFTRYPLPAICEALWSCETIVHLDIRNSNLQLDGAIQIANLLEHTQTLQSIFLFKNELFDQGVELIVRVLIENPNHSLQKLNLCQNGITDKGAEVLANLISTNKSLTALDVNNNHITSNGAFVLAPSLASNRNLLLFSVWNNQICESGAQELLRVFRESFTLQALNVRRNSQVLQATVEAVEATCRLKAKAQKVNEAVDSCNLFSMFD